MKTWMPFRLLLYLWGLTGCHRSSDPSLVGWSGSRGSRENGHPNAHFLFLNWSLCPVTHDISSLPWALTEIIKAQRQASRALTAPTPAPLALSPKSPGKQASLNTQAQSKRSPGCTLHEDKEHVCLGLVLPATGHWKQASTLVGWKRARDGRENVSRGESCWNQQVRASCFRNLKEYLVGKQDQIGTQKNPSWLLFLLLKKERPVVFTLAKICVHQQMNE